jgi:hypothetical protein
VWLIQNSIRHFGFIRQTTFKGALQSVLTECVLHRLEGDLEECVLWRLEVNGVLATLLVYLHSHVL